MERGYCRSRPSRHASDSLFQHAGPDTVQVKVHTHGQLTLVRGALENASLALWLLEDDQLAERIVRRMQEEWDEIRQLENCSQ